FGDWSSDVCSSDLLSDRAEPADLARAHPLGPGELAQGGDDLLAGVDPDDVAVAGAPELHAGASWRKAASPAVPRCSNSSRRPGSAPMPSGLTRAPLSSHARCAIS